MPIIVSAFNWPERYGSTENPSQFRPPSGVRPNGPALGPSGTLTDKICFQQTRLSSLRDTIRKMLTSLYFKLLAHVEPSFICKVPIPARPNMDSRWIRVDHVRCANSIAGIVNTHSRPSQPRNGAGVTSTDVIAAISTRNVGSFFYGHLLHKLFGTAVCICPLPIPFTFLCV